MEGAQVASSALESVNLWTLILGEEALLAFLGAFVVLVGSIFLNLLSNGNKQAAAEEETGANGHVVGYGRGGNSNLSQLDVPGMRSILEEAVESDEFTVDRVQRMWSERKRLRVAEQLGRGSGTPMAAPVVRYETAPAAPMPATPFLSSPAAPSSSLYSAQSKAAAAAPKKKSYSMTKWSPDNPVRSGPASYLDGVGIGGTSAPVSAFSVPSVPSIGGAPPKKSYSMTKWSPDKAVVSSGPSSSSYLSTIMGSGQGGESAAPAPPSSSFMAAAPVSNAAQMPLKKSYSMTKWSPETPVSTGTSYLDAIGTKEDLAAPATMTYSTPPVTSSQIGTETKSYSMTKWSPNAPVVSTGSSYLDTMGTPHGAAPLDVRGPTAANSNANVGGAAQKKSNSMTKWSPDKPVADVGSSYLASMDNTIAPGSLPPAPSAAEYVDSAVSSATTGLGAPKKSYSMTKWSPDKPVTTTGTLYLETMGTGGPAASPAPPGAIFVPPTSPSTNVSSDTQKKSYAMTKWSPEKPVISTGTYLDAINRDIEGDPIVAPTAAASAKTEEGSQRKSYSMTKWTPDKTVQSGLSYLDTMGAKNAEAPPPAVAVPVSEIKNAVSSTEKKSYSMTKWTPDSPVRTGASYLDTMGTNDALAPAPSPPMTSYVSSFDPEVVSGGSTSNPKSYSMTKWTPGTPVKSVTGSGSSYLDGMNSIRTSGPIPSAPSPTLQPALGIDSSVHDSTVGSSTGVKKSYSMTKWTPGTPLKGVAGAGSSYLQGMSSSAGGSSPIGAPLSAPGSYLSSFESNAGSAVSSSSGAKKSYSMTKWTPGTPIKGVAGAGSSYLQGMSSSTGGSSPIGAPLSAPGSYLTSFESNAGIAVSSSSEPKKTYSMTKWTPGTPVKGVTGASASFLDSVKSNNNEDSPSVTQVSSAPSPTPAPGSYLSSFDTLANSGSIAAKTSYAMTKWTPGTPVKKVVGSGASYLDGMSSISGGTSATRPVYSVPESTPAAASTSIYLSSFNIGASTVISDSSSKKSYSMTKWTPNTPVVGLTGPGASYLDGVSSSKQASVSQTPSLAPSGYVSSFDTSTGSSGSKNSYSMTKWTPNTHVKAISGPGTSYLDGMSSSYGKSSVAPTSSPTSAPAPANSYLSSVEANASITAGSSKKSYSMTKWTPGTNIKSVTGAGAHYFDGMSSSDSGSLSVSSPVSSAPSPPGYFGSEGGSTNSDVKKSYFMTKWTPDSPVKSVTGVIGSYLDAMRSSAGESASVTPVSKPPAPPSASPLVSSAYDNTDSKFSSGAKKSYSMTKWTPGTPLIRVGSGASYLDDMSAGGAGPAPTALAPSPPSSPPASPGSAFLRSETGSNAFAPKKSYLMTKWTQKSPVEGTFGAMASYFAGISTSAPTTGGNKVAGSDDLHDGHGINGSSWPSRAGGDDAPGSVSKDHQVMPSATSSLQDENKSARNSLNHNNKGSATELWSPDTPDKPVPRGMARIYLDGI
jgi:hypothetical protein